MLMYSSLSFQPWLVPKSVSEFQTASLPQESNNTISGQVMTGEVMPRNGHGLIITEYEPQREKNSLWADTNLSVQAQMTRDWKFWI